MTGNKSRYERASDKNSQGGTALVETTVAGPLGKINRTKNSRGEDCGRQKRLKHNGRSVEVRRVRWILLNQRKNLNEIKKSGSVIE